MVTSVYLPDSVHGLLELETTAGRVARGSFISRAVQSALVAHGTLAGTILAALRAQADSLTVSELVARCPGFTEEAIVQALALLVEDTPSAPARVRIVVYPGGASRYALTDVK